MRLHGLPRGLTPRGCVGPRCALYCRAYLVTTVTGPCGTIDQPVRGGRVLLRRQVQLELRIAETEIDIDN